MLKKFVDGLVFGSGFSLSFVVVWFAVSYFAMPLIMDSQMEMIDEIKGSFNEIPETKNKNALKKVEKQFDGKFIDLPVDEQIKVSSVIMLVKFIPSRVGKTKAVITEFIKKDQDIEFYYDIGNEHPPSSFYPNKDYQYGDGRIVFFTGSPPIMTLSTTYFGDRITSLGDMPIQLFREKSQGG